MPVDATTILPHNKPVLTRDPAYPRLVVVPTVGKPEVVLPTFRLLRAHIPPGTRVVVVVNPLDADDGAHTAALVEAMGVPDGCKLDVILFPGPVGFSGANNAGIQYANATGGVGDTIVSFNDDLRATAGWLESLEAALNADEIVFGTEIPHEGGARTRFPRAGWGRVGIVGPVTTVAAGAQGAAPYDKVRELGHAAFAKVWRENAGDSYIHATFLSGFCMAISRACADDLMIPCPVAGFGIFDTERYPIAGYEDNDLCVRATNAGWRLAIDWANYVGHVGHQTFDGSFPEMQRGMRNRGAYYEKFAPLTQRTDQRLVGVYRVKIGSVQDLYLFDASLKRHAGILDGVAVLLTNNPIRDMQAYPDWPTRGRLDAPEQTLLKALSGTVDVGDPTGADWRTRDDVATVRKLVDAWVKGTLLNAPGTRFDRTNITASVNVEVWTGDFNERTERNHAIELAHALNPDWLLSIDHDECLEDRLRRGHFERWMTHPDPAVLQFEFGWLDHWNDSQHFRTDPPWGDGGKYTGGRRGRRMWRFRKGLSTGDRIFLGNEKGLHCGNVPDVGVTAPFRSTGGRFRHFGYVRQLDRLQRYQRYSTLDPNPRADLMGGPTYRHIVSAEGMRIEFFNPQNGIVLHMLVYGGEDPGRIADKLDQFYALVDHIVLVWTDAAAPDAPHAEGGMSPELARYAELFKADVIHAPLRDAKGVNFAATRNAAIEHATKVNEASKLGLGWGLIVDPDETIGESWELVQVALRRMAEASEVYGWLFRYTNPTTNGVITGSDSVRLHRLDPIMRMRGRVHEGFDVAIRAITEKGGSPTMRVAPFMSSNPGLSNPKTIAAKIRGYSEGLIAEIEENPHNGSAWASLGLQFEAEGRHDEALKAYMTACQTMPESYLGFRAMMAHHLRTALAFAAETRAKLSSAHDYAPILDQIIRFLQEAAPAPGNPAGVNVLDGVSLPATPDELAEAARLAAGYERRDDSPEWLDPDADPNELQVPYTIERVEHPDPQAG